MITARRPDIVVIDKAKKEALIVDVAIPADHNRCEKETEKITKYQDLKMEIQQLWNMKSVRVVPIVVGALRVTSLSLQKHLEILPGNYKEGQLVTQALLGTAHILPRVLDLQGLR
jgi:hypothetical protein